MPRLPQITSREVLAEDKRHIFDEIVASRGRVGGPFPLLLHSPEVAGRVAHLGTYMRFESGLPAADRELAVLTTTREWDCGTECGGHVGLGRQVGVREEAIDAVAHRRELDGLTAEEALVIKYCRELLRDHRVSNDTLEAARVRYGDQGLVDLTALVGYYVMLACVLNAFEAEPAPNAPRLP